jgi:acyl-CoA synthetase (AMP-forming)/AMP-acid ligase II
MDFADILNIPYAYGPLSCSYSCLDLDLATIIYTSGSTGEPKGVMSAHYNVLAATRSIAAYLKNVEDDIILNALPLSFDYGLYQVLMAAFFGGTVILEKSFMFPYKVLERLVQEKATGFPIVPTMLSMLLQLDNPKRFDFRYLRYISNTAAALPVSHIRQLRGLLPHVEVYSMYGLTECKRVSYLPPQDIDRKPDSVGIAMPNEEVFIVDEKGDEVAPGDIGQLMVRGSNVMQGYWRDPEETAKRFRPGKTSAETLLYTGDLFRRDEEGFLYFIARNDDMIKTKGERVSPKEIENVLLDIDGVVEAAVVGVTDEIFGQAIKAFIVVKDHNVNENVVLKHCAQMLESFMVPKYIEFKDILPKTSTGKLDKKLLTVDS